jgi:hypothetical protein
VRGLQPSSTYCRHGGSRHSDRALERPWGRFDRTFRRMPLPLRDSALDTVALLRLDGRVTPKEIDDDGEESRHSWIRCSAR